MARLFAVRSIVIVLFALLFTPHVYAEQAPRFKAVAFDYFVLFDASSITPTVEQAFPGKGAEFTGDFVKLWRSKQFEYGFLRSITHRQDDFFKVTADALVYTANAMQLELTAEKKQQLLNAYLHLKPWPDTVAALRKLKASGVRIITIANFSPMMLKANADAAGITDLFDELISTQATNGSFKPEPRAYELGMQRLHLNKQDIVFAAFGGWDAYGARSFGYPTYWVNRFKLPTEELGLQADQTSNDLQGLLEYILGKS